MAEYTAQELLEVVNTTAHAPGDDRVRQVTTRIVSDLFHAVEDLDASAEEFWAAVKWLGQVGAAGEIGLITAALGFDRLLDIREDEKEAAAGLVGGTPRAIEGPLYVPDAPLSTGEARLDDGSQAGEVLFMSGRVLDGAGRPIPEAVVHVWHASPGGGYSHFDPGLPPFAYRRRIRTDAGGGYRFRTLTPSGYAVPPGGPTDRLLVMLGRHGHRPAHIHFMVEAEGYATLTTQVNLPGDTYIDDDMAFATRDGLVVTLERCGDPDEIRARGLSAPFAETRFDFHVRSATAAAYIHAAA